MALAATPPSLKRECLDDRFYNAAANERTIERPNALSTALQREFKPSFVEATKRRSDEATKRRSDEATKRRSDEATKRRSDEATKRRSDEATAT